MSAFEINFSNNFPFTSVFMSDENQRKENCLIQVVNNSKPDALKSVKMILSQYLYGDMSLCFFLHPQTPPSPLLSHTSLLWL